MKKWSLEVPESAFDNAVKTLCNICKPKIADAEKYEDETLDLYIVMWSQYFHIKPYILSRKEYYTGLNSKIIGMTKIWFMSEIAATDCVRVIDDDMRRRKQELEHRKNAKFKFSKGSYVT